MKNKALAVPFIHPRKGMITVQYPVILKSYEYKMQPEPPGEDIIKGGKQRQC